jgi:hypothetical protein
MIDTAGHRYNDYDELGRIDSTNDVFTHTHNTAGLPASTTYPDSQTISRPRSPIRVKSTMPKIGHLSSRETVAPTREAH